MKTRQSKKKELLKTEIHKLPWKINFLIVGLIAAAIVAYDVYGWGGNIAFYTKWHECGQRPVESRGSGYMNAGAIHYVEAPVFSFARGDVTHYCTPLEAEKAGLSANPEKYEFPHIEAERAKEGVD